MGRRAYFLSPTFVPMITTIFLVVLALRLVSLSISRRHEKQLIADGAQEYGARTSRLLSVAHVIYYLSAITEAWLRDVHFDVLSGIATLFLIFSLMVLFTVIRQLGPIWTVKLYIHPQHTLNRSWLFESFRHPNYFLNIVPEMIGIGLLCHAWATMIVGLPIYTAILAARIQQEDEVMKELRDRED